MNAERLKHNSKSKWNAYAYGCLLPILMRWWWSTFAWEEFQCNFMVNTAKWWIFQLFHLLLKTTTFICKFLISDDEVTWMIRCCFCCDCTASTRRWLDVQWVDNNDSDICLFFLEFHSNRLETGIRTVIAVENAFLIIIILSKEILFAFSYSSD